MHLSISRSLRALLFLSGAALYACGEAEVPAVCGGLQGLACDAGEFCNFPIAAQCGAADQTGSCEAVPEACTKEYAPVCGCDDVTYGNACLAHAAGVSVAAEGACGGPSEQACGGLLGLACDAGSFCDYPLDALCGAADQTGVCRKIPELCTEQYEPVCGCDGKTYGNRCEANASGTSISREGTCEPPPVSCDRSELRCRRAEPRCPEGQVAEIVNGCYGACVPIDACVCSEASECPDEASYTCHLNRGRCGPYVR